MVAWRWFKQNNKSKVERDATKLFLFTLMINVIYFANFDFGLEITPQKYTFMKVLLLSNYSLLPLIEWTLLTFYPICSYEILSLGDPETHGRSLSIEYARC